LFLLQKIAEPGSAKSLTHEQKFGFHLVKVKEGP
jgi:hypothetical protein